MENNIKHTSKEKCGCKTKTTTFKYPGNMISWLEKTTLCKKHKKYKKDIEKQHQQEKIERISYTEEIKCDICKEFVCYAYSGGDLNCNYFYCIDCYTKHHK